MDANPKACEAHPYATQLFICADAALTLHALADKLEQLKHRDALAIDITWTAQIQAARAAAEAQVDSGLAAYVTLKNAVKDLVNAQTKRTPDSPPVWVQAWGEFAVKFAGPPRKV